MTYMTVVPKLVVAGADAAIEFYRKALGAELTARYTAGDGSVVYAEVCIGETRISIKDEDGFDRSASTIGGSAIILTLDVADADTVANSLIDAGATVDIPVADRPYGYRQGRVTDPFGYQWIISQPIDTPTSSPIDTPADHER
ncbi:VOC family protein [Actinobacteria bacterium YIM 96077]|uniref:VOC family protein n=1 Tax=Phytoactinopolyspora halophila TaxID=1981511 RepID=A0A329QAH3_9ACTN|nr:VOC family protein [Phytoactinopolyspora halophila]AYY12479.1 VOC family protein [Actinobacteria bacterium YIM 96077]RAW09324.1 VOC family protein [Phytoactinopolyspora halophila]